MKVIEFHPDDLLDRELRGALSDDEGRRLDEHLARCSACRLERQLRADFDGELVAEGPPPSLQTFISGAIRAARASESPIPASKAQGDDVVVPEAPRVPKLASVPPGVRAWRRRGVFLLAATLLFATGIAAAETGLAARSWSFARSEIVSVLSPESTTAPAEAARAQKTAAPPSAPLADRPLPADLPPVPPAEEADPMPAVANPVVPVLATTAASHAIVAKAAAPLGVPAASFAPEARAPRVDTASDLFERANAARARGSLFESAALYHDLEERFPRSAEARLSIAVMARMQLDRGENAAALDGFGAYLTTGDSPLRQEAMEGRALALQRLGRRAEENDAWRELLRAYPMSASATLARRRLGQDNLER